MRAESAADVGYVCNDCTVARWAPERVSKVPHGWCHTMLSWVVPDEVACDEIEPTDEAYARLGWWLEDETPGEAEERLERAAWREEMRER